MIKKLGHFFTLETRVLKKNQKEIPSTYNSTFVCLFIYLVSVEEVIVMSPPGHWEMYGKMLKQESQ